MVNDRQNLRVPRADLAAERALGALGYFAIASEPSSSAGLTDRFVLTSHEDGVDDVRSIGRLLRGLGLWCITTPYSYRIRGARHLNAGLLERQNTVGRWTEVDIFHVSFTRTKIVFIASIKILVSTFKHEPDHRPAPLHCTWRTKLPPPG